MTYPFKFHERIKSLERIGFEFIGHTKYVNERDDHARDSKKI